MKKGLSALLFLMISVFTFSAEKKKIVIGIVYDGLMEQNTKVEETIEKEVRDILGNKYEVTFPKEKQLTDSFNKDDISRKIDELLADESVDMVINAGMLSSYVSLDKENITKPVFSPFLFNELLYKETPNKKNLNYISSNMNFAKEIEEFKSIKEFNKLTVVIGKNILNIIPQMEDILGSYLETSNIEINYAVIEDVENLKSLYKEIDSSEAVLLAPINNIPKEEVLELISYMNKKKIPIFSIFDSSQLDEGVLAGYSFEKQLRKRIRAMAINLLFYLEGQAMNTLSTSINSTDSELVINMKTVEETGIWPNWEILSKAKLINFIPEQDFEEALTLKEVIDVSLNNNPSINTLRIQIEEADLNIKKAKGDYKPDITANVTGALLDEDTAGSVFSPAEQSVTAGISLTQVVFSEDANMNIDIQKEKKKLKYAELEKAKLDLILETAEAYFNVLKAEAYSRIQKTNLELTKKNMEIAKNKKSAGISGAADIYRWESELANGVSELTESILNVNLAKINLKRIMNYDLKEKLKLRNLDFTDKEFLVSDERLLGYISNQNKINILSNYMIENLLKYSPELKSIEYGINIQNRLVKNSNNKRFLPTVALQANYTKNLMEGGIGSEDPRYTNLDYGDYSILQSFGADTDSNWNVGVRFSLPIYNGGKIKADKEIAENEIQAMEYQKELAVKYLEQRVMSYLLQVVSEYSKIQNAEVSANSASKALNLVKDAYSRGVVTISDLMSAQMASISAEQYRSTVKYDLMLAIMKAERSVGSFYIEKTPEEKEVFIKELIQLERKF